LGAADEIANEFQIISSFSLYERQAIKASSGDGSREKTVGQGGIPSSHKAADGHTHFIEDGERDAITV